MHTLHIPHDIQVSKQSEPFQVEFHMATLWLVEDQDMLFSEYFSDGGGLHLDEINVVDHKDTGVRLPQVSWSWKGMDWNVTAAQSHLLNSFQKLSLLRLL